MTRFTILSLFVSCTALIHAQTTGAVEGTVVDPSGAPVGGASVRVIESLTGVQRLLRTDVRGYYAAYGLAPGRHRIEVSQQGFRTQDYPAAEVGAGRTVRVDLQIEIGEAHDKIVVMAEAPLVSAAASEWGGSIGGRRLESLPLNGRDLFDLASQEPGATVPTTARKSLAVGLGVHVSVNGARPNQNSFRQDGIYINDATSAAPSSALGNLLGLEAVSELRLVTSPFNAEYGRTSGAVLTAVSKSGSNDFRGSAYEFLRNSALDARNFFDLADSRMPPLRRSQFGGLLSGPLRRDKLFFLVNYEGVRETRGQTLRPVTLTAEARQGRLPGPNGVRIVPVAPQMLPYLDLYPLPNGRDFGDGTAEFVMDSIDRSREDYVTGKLDALLSARLRVSSRYTFDSANFSEPDPFRIWAFGSNSRYHFAQTQAQYVQSASTVHTFRAGLSRVLNSETARLPESVPKSLSFVPGQPLGAIQVAGLSDVGGSRARLRPQRYVLNDFQFNHDLISVRGSHTIRLGGGYDRVQFNPVTDVNAAGFYRFSSIAGFLQGKPQSGDVMLPGSSTARGWRQNQFSVFVQDEYRVGAHLNLAFGARFEPYSTPVEVNNLIATLPDPLRDLTTTVGGPLFHNPSRQNFAPRLSLAWDPAGSGNTVIRAGAGIFFDLLGARELIVPAAQVPPFFQRVAPVNPGFPNLLEAAKQATPPNTLDVLDFYPNQPYVMQFQLDLERQVGSALVAGLGYAGSRGIHLPMYLGNVNPTRPEARSDGQIFFPEDAPRLNPAFERIGMLRTQANSFHRAFLASVRRLWRNGFQFQAKYTWAKTMDEASNGIFRDFVATDYMPTMFNYRQNRGLADFDVRHVLAVNFSYQVPDWRGGGVRRAFTGWEVHGLARAQTGYPFSPRVGFDRARLRAGGSVGDLGQRPDYATAAETKAILGDPERYFDPLAFALPPAGVYGNLGRNALTGPGLATLDLAVHKVLWRTEHQSLRIRLEAFNVTNHPNFQIPSGLALFDSQERRLGSAGRITETSTTSRQVQLAAKWMF